MRFWTTIFGIAVVGVLVGCRSAPERVLPITELPLPPPVVVPPTNHVADVSPHLPTQPNPPSIATNRTTDAWIPWNRWCVTNGLGLPEHGPSAASPQYALRTSHGTLAITLGSRLASWHGVDFWLGFAPQRIDGQPYVHALDAQKNFQPLLSDTNGLGDHRAVLVLDPGHGGENTGTRSVLGNHFEKEYTLDWARRLQSLLATNGWTVYLTRTNDTDLSLSNRVALAERVKADLFLSLHFNSAFPNEKQTGLETYCLTPSGLPSSLTRDFPDDARQVFPNNAFDEPNLQLATRLQRALVATTAEPDRGVRRARFMGVLRGQHRPAVLIEGGYLSNPTDARLIASGSYRQKLANAIARVLGERVESSVASSGAAGTEPAAGP